MPSIAQANRCGANDDLFTVVFELAIELAIEIEFGIEFGIECAIALVVGVVVVVALVVTFVGALRCVSADESWPIFGLEIMAAAEVILQSNSSSS